MGIFDRLWKKDENEELRRAKSLLAEGEAERALKLARRLLKQGGPLSAEIQDLIDKAENHLSKECLAAAAHSESQGSFSDAADWIMAALTFVHDPVRIEALQQRADDLRGKGGKDTGPDFAPAPMEQESETDLDPETHFYTLTGMLREDISERYERLPEPFRQAFILANTGRLAEARALFDQMVADNPTDPVIRFERARCALLQENAEQARQDLDEVARVLGDEPLDLGGSLFVAGLWSEAMLKLEKPAPVVERLQPLTQPDKGPPGLSLLYALALEKTGEIDEAIEVLFRTSRRFDRDPGFPLHIARILAQRGEHERAIDCLEISVAPSCSSGSCMGVAKHAPSLRLLISLYLEHQLKPKRVAELMLHLEQAVGGFRARPDLLLLAKWHEGKGDHEAAEHARAAAEEAIGKNITDVMPASMANADQPIL